jgi:hypothetical protein
LDHYTTQTTERGDQTYVLLGGETFCVCCGKDHASDAQHVAELLNDELGDVCVLAGEVVENFPP